MSPTLVEETNSSTTSSAVSTACQGTSTPSLLLSLMVMVTECAPVLLLAGAYCVERLAILMMEACSVHRDQQLE